MGFGRRGRDERGAVEGRREVYRIVMVGFISTPSQFFEAASTMRFVMMVRITGERMSTHFWPGQPIMSFPNTACVNWLESGRPDSSAVTM